MQWDHIDYHVGAHYLPALINADLSGLEDQEIADLGVFVAQAQYADVPAGFVFGHWSSDPDDEGEDFRRCDVSGMHAGCVLLRAHYFKN